MIRAFVALSISELLEAQLKLHASSLAQQLSHEKMRWIPSCNYHITLAFLGDINPQIVPKIEAAMNTVAAKFQPVELVVSDVAWFPSLHKPRLLVATLEESTELMSLQSKLCNVLRQQGVKLEGRHFKPHISLARAGRQQQPKRFQLALGDLATEMDELVLFESQLTPNGSRYVPLSASLIEY